MNMYMCNNYGCLDEHYTCICIHVHLAIGRTHSHTVMERKVQDHYELGDVIEEGGFGSVCAGTCRQNGDAVSTVRVCTHA